MSKETMNKHRLETIRKQSKKCSRCGVQITMTGPATKYCPSCRDIVNRENIRASEIRQRSKARKRKPKGSTLDELSMMARKMGISYGRLQAMRYMGQI